MKYRLEAARVTAEADAEMLVPHSLDLTSLKTTPASGVSRWSSLSREHEFSRIPTNPAEICTSPFQMCCLLTVVSRGRFRQEARSQRASTVKGSLQMTNTAKTAIVTGASRGIGAGLVEAFVKRGYSVVANSRNITKANPFAASANLALVDGDIGDRSTAAKIVDTAVSKFGRIDVLVNNAGVFIPKAFTEYTTEDFDTLVSTTLAGFLYVSQLAVRQMLRQKSGSILNVSTTLVDQPITGYAKEGIRVNTIAPGVINTPMHKPETHDFLKGLHPVGRIGEVKEVVDAVLFLTDATFTSGEILHVDGGAHAGKW